MPTLSRVHASLSTHSNDTRFTRFVMSAIALSASTARAAFASKGYVRSRERRHESNRRARRSTIGTPEISLILTTPHPPPSLSVPSNRSLSSRLRVRAKLAAPVGNEPRARRAVTVYAGPDDDDDDSATSAKSAPMLEKYREVSGEFGGAKSLVELIDMDLPGEEQERDELKASVTKLTALINELGEFVQDHDANGGYKEGLVDLSRELVSEIVDWMEELSSRME